MMYRALGLRKAYVFLPTSAQSILPENKLDRVIHILATAGWHRPGLPAGRAGPRGSAMVGSISRSVRRDYFARDLPYTWQAGSLC